MIMKKLIKWLADKFGVTTVKTVYVEKKTLINYFPKVGTVDGDLIVKGSLTVTGSVTCFKEKGGPA